MLLVVSEPHATVVVLAIDNATVAAVAIRLRYLSIRPAAAPVIPAGERNGAYRDVTRSDLRRGE
jgi:hypothetical protein